jgi:hypothetical protein
VAQKRFISVGYYALVNHKDVSPIGDELSESCDWIILDELESQNITMDHKKIIEKALNTLREQISYKPIGLNLFQKNSHFQSFKNCMKPFLEEP